MQDDKDGEIVKQVVLQSGAKVGLSLQHEEDISSISVALPTSEKGKVTEKFLSIKVSRNKLINSYRKLNGVSFLMILIV